MQHLAVRELLPLPLPLNARRMLHQGAEQMSNAAIGASPPPPPPTQNVTSSSGSTASVRAEVYLGIFIPFIAVLIFCLMVCRPNGWGRSMLRSGRRADDASTRGGVLRHSGDEYLVAPCAPLKEVEVFIVEQPDASRLFATKEDAQGEPLPGGGSSSSSSSSSSSRSSRRSAVMDASSGPAAGASSGRSCARSQTPPSGSEPLLDVEQRAGQQPQPQPSQLQQLEQEK